MIMKKKGKFILSYWEAIGEISWNLLAYMGA